jgi:hypothetical protein
LDSDEGNDELRGLAGRDTLNGGDGSDLMDGGDDFDRYSDDFDLAAPFCQAQSVFDIDQQASDTCQTLASLAAAVVGDCAEREQTHAPLLVPQVGELPRKLVARVK